MSDVNFRIPPPGEVNKIYWAPAEVTNVGQTIISVPHGLGFLPSRVWISPIGTWLLGAVSPIITWIVVGATPTQIIFRISQAVVTPGDLTFYWFALQ